MNYFVSLDMYVNKLTFAELQANASVDNEQIRVLLMKLHV